MGGGGGDKRGEDRRMTVHRRDGESAEECPPMRSIPGCGCYQCRAVTGDEALAFAHAEAEVAAEYSRALAKYGPFNSTHEGLAVLWEEFEELKAAVFTNAPIEAQREEAKQVAAMALRFMVDCCGGADR